MKLIEIINNNKWVFLESAQVDESSNLVIIFVIGSVSNEHVNTIVGEAFPVVYDDQSERYKVVFNDFVGYSILDESYDNIDTSHEINIDGFRIYRQSNFLDYILKDTFATQIIEKDILHYFFFTQNNLINVASSEAPEIIKLNTAKPKLH